MMKINVLEEKENPFLKRKELMLIVDHPKQATPKKTELEDAIAEKFKADKQKVEVVYIFSQKGLAKSKVKARIWKEKIVRKIEEKKEEPKQEPKQKEQVEPKREPEQKEQAKPEEPKQEPAEEKKEEPEPKQETVEEKKEGDSAQEGEKSEAQTN